MKRIPIVAAGIALLASSSFAQETYKIDPVHSSVNFKIRHFFSKVPGRFKDFQGTIRLDSKDTAKSSVEATIQTGGIDTGIEKRDADLRSDHFFDVAKYPTMTFKSTDWRLVERDTYAVTGDLTLHGVTKPVTLHVKFLGSGPDTWGGYRSGWEATTTLDRTLFGVSWNKAIEGGGTMLGNDVEITLNIEAVRQKPEAK